jgi:hypothetical protein
MLRIAETDVGPVIDENATKTIEKQLEKHKKWEAQDIERDCDRLAELEDDERDDDYFCEYGCGEYDYEPCGPDEILDGGPGSYPEWLND